MEYEKKWFNSGTYIYHNDVFKQACEQINIVFQKITEINFQHHDKLKKY